MTTDAGTLGPADHLVIAAGSQPNFYGVPGAAEHSFPLYSVERCGAASRGTSGTGSANCARPTATAR